MPHTEFVTGSEPPQLNDVERARWDAVRSAISGFARSMRAGDLDAGGFDATWQQVRQIDVDLARVRDALHVPDDAGEFAAPLEALLRRIPDGWGRWISCDAGWYQLVVDLDAWPLSTRSAPTASRSPSIGKPWVGSAATLA